MAFRWQELSSQQEWWLGLGSLQGWRLWSGCPALVYAWWGEVWESALSFMFVSVCESVCEGIVKEVMEEARTLATGPSTGCHIIAVTLMVVAIPQETDVGFVGLCRTQVCGVLGSAGHYSAYLDASKSAKHLWSLHIPYSVNVLVKTS